MLSACRKPACLLLPLLVCIAAPVSAAAAARPNILLIVADDLGYSDLGAFGGEIETPTIDALAAGGALLTNFHTSPSCSPTRAMLLTGVDNHLAGLGNMKELRSARQSGRPGYEGFLNRRVVTIASLLEDSGYRTYLSGKWHLGEQPGQYPTDRGFSRSFALLQGAGNHFDERGYWARQPTVDYVQDGERVALDDGFYSTTTFTDRMLEFIADDDGSQPFFAYLAYTAPHWPLQVPAAALADHEPIYAAGWDRIRAARFERMQALGIVPAASELPPRRDGVPAWDALAAGDRARAARTMAGYAAMVTLMDRQVARLLRFLDERGELDDTIVIFMSDNGAEGRDLAGFPHFAPWIREHYDRGDDPASSDTFLFAGPGWGQVSATPHRDYKGSTSEGGLRSPLIVHAPGRVLPGLRDAFSQVTDLAVTLLHLGGVTHPGERYRGRAVVPPSGRSLLPYLGGKADAVYAPDEPVGFELNGHAALYRGAFKAVRLGPPFGDGRWSLFRVDSDPAETVDLAAAMPRRLKSLQMAYDGYSQRVGVVPR